MMILFGMIDKDKYGDGRKEFSIKYCEFASVFFEFSRTREMNLSTQECEEKRKQLLAKELAIKRNLSLV